MGTPRTELAYPLDLVALGDDRATPLYRQLCDQLRRLILTGAVPSGTRIPSIRAAALGLGVSRNTVVAALDQLAAEGLLETHHGQGTRVAAAAPARAAPAAGAYQSAAGDGLSARGRLMAAQPRVRTRPGHSAFHPGTPAIEEFPFKTWSRILSRTARAGGEDLFGYHYIAGHPDLREAIASFLTAMRGVRCSPEQIVVTTGGQAALDLLARLLLDEGDTVWMEEPGYLGARGAFLAAGARLAPLAVGRDGWQLPRPDAPAPRLVYLTPSCQHPLGITMPLDGRREMLARARRHDAWVVEDDFDGEYTFRGAPLPAMQGLDAQARVVYLGTFAKTLFPSMRLGFAVLPRELAERARTALSLTGQFAPLVPQAALAAFIREGFFFRHLNRMRRLYARRRATFMRLLADELGDLLDPIDGRTGIQIAAPFRVPLGDRAVVARCHAEGIHPAPLSLYFVGPPALSGLLLGYAGLAEPAMQRAIPRLRHIVEEAARLR